MKRGEQPTVEEMFSIKGVIIDDDEDSVDIPLPLDVVEGLEDIQAFGFGPESLDKPSLKTPEEPADRHAAHVKSHIVGGHRHH
ncbi:hypothetical protein BDV12DRAFT_205212 [Aspergillus spectabilis]